MQGIVKIIARDCPKLRVWEQGLSGPLLFHHSFVFYWGGFRDIKHSSGAVSFVLRVSLWSGAALLEQLKCPLQPLRGQAGNLEGRTLAKFAHPFFGGSFYSSFSSVNCQFSKGFTVRMGFTQAQVPPLCGFLPFLLLADSTSQKMLIFKSLKVTFDIGLFCFCASWMPHFMTCQLTMLERLLFSKSVIIWPAKSFVSAVTRQGNHSFHCVIVIKTLAHKISQIGDGRRVAQFTIVAMGSLSAEVCISSWSQGENFSPKSQFHTIKLAII